MNKEASYVKQGTDLDGVGIILVEKNDLLLSHWIV